VFLIESLIEIFQFSRSKSHLVDFLESKVDERLVEQEFISFQVE
jgi:hypothetical protein